MSQHHYFLNVATVVCICLSFPCFYLVLSQTSYYPMANVSTNWINHPVTVINSSWHPTVSDPGVLSIILLRESIVARFICGFYCTRNISTECFLGVLISPEDQGDGFNNPTIQSSQVVWSANRDNPVKANATLNFTRDGDLVLADADGRIVWSTNTSSKSVAGLNLTEMGNLLLFDSKNRSVWQSFDHQTDSLVLGQKLRSGQRLTSRVSDSDSSEGIYSLVAENGTLVAYIESSPPQVYYYSDIYEGLSTATRTADIKFENGSFDNYTFSPATTAQVMKLESDGHLRVYAWSNSDWVVIGDLLDTVDCGYPMLCGKYGICSRNQCSCPEIDNGDTSFFKPVNSREPSLGCFLTAPIDCDHYQYHSLIELENINYFDSTSNLYGENIKLQQCKEACLKNCSCKAVVFTGGYALQSEEGSCSLLNEVFSLRNDEEASNTVSLFVKVQKTSTGSNSLVNSPKSKSRRVIVILGSSLGAIFGILLVVGACSMLLVKFMKIQECEEVHLDQVPGMLLRFSYVDLKDMTNNFSDKLGTGGFGSVYRGTLRNGEQIAVKCLDGLGLAKKSFLAEVETIGSIHHVNLVRLIGFCAEKSYRLLVYEYMHNGSLDKWIFCTNKGETLGWLLRKSIILDVAKGLAYLHEECRQKIVHMDIKPQNILLDEDFIAKISDFGLSKLIEKDQSQVVTTLRGTPGYMAPEWLSFLITEKVDVYSFGVMVLEILCGRKNLDRSQSEDEAHLLGIFKRKAEKDELLDLVDKDNEDMQLHGSQVVEYMKAAAWCLQGDYRTRPSMSDVVKVLEGTMEVESNLVYDFETPPETRLNAGSAVATTVLPSVLSGPR